MPIRQKMVISILIMLNCVKIFHLEPNVPFTSTLTDLRSQHDIGFCQKSRYPFHLWPWIALWDLFYVMVLFYSIQSNMS